MKKIGLYLVAIMFLATGSSFAAKTAKTRYRAYTPSASAKSAFLKSKDGQRRYFVVEKGTSFGFDVVGPTKIKIRTRPELNAGVQNPEYQVQVWDGDNMTVGHKVKAKQSLLTLEGQKVGIGTAHTIIFKVPKGKHSYRLWISSDKVDKYYARFYQAKKPAKKSAYSAFKPTEFKKQITLVAGKKNISYYLINETDGAALNVIGPTKLRIFCRANFSKEMKGNAKFTLGLFEGGKEVVQFPGVAKMAQNLQFKELGDLIPSLLYTFDFDVPGGKHTYQIRKINSASPSLAVRFKITKVGLGMIP